MVCGVVVAGLEVIEADFGVVIVASIAQGVDVCHRAALGEDIAPSVIGIGCSRCVARAAGIRLNQLHHIALQVQDIVICREAATAVGRVLQRREKRGYTKFLVGRH